MNSTSKLDGAERKFGPVCFIHLGRKGNTWCGSKKKTADFIRRSIPLPQERNSVLFPPPQQGQAALGLSAPVRVGLDPLAKALGFTWAPWAEAALDRVNLGAACWKTTDDFPLRGGLYFRVTALEWEF